MTASAMDDLDTAYAEVRRDPYEFRWAEQSWSLPHLGSLDYRLQAEIETLNELDVERLENLFARMFGAEQASRWADVEVPTPVLFMLFDRWVKHAGAQPGESLASEPSSESTGASSNPTSDASTASASPRPSTAKRASRKAASRRESSST